MVPFPDPGAKWPISNDGGVTPIWSADGNELFYVQADKMMAVNVKTSPTFSAGTPRTLFTGRFIGSVKQFDISPDGRRFLRIQPTEPAQAGSQINVVINWFQELKRRVPVEN